MIVKLVVGDWSKDGHSQTESFVYDSNKNGSDIAKAFTKGAKLIGLPITKSSCSWIKPRPSYCEDYGASKLDDATIEALEKLDAYKGLFDVNPYLDWDGYAQMYIDVAMHGDPALKAIVSNSHTEINIGGYGLFE